MKRLFAILELLAVFAWQLIKANLQVALFVFFYSRELQPLIVRIESRLDSSFQMYLFASLITLTPGTLALDVNEVDRSLIIHFLHAPDVEAAIAGVRMTFEQRILGVFS